MTDTITSQNIDLSSWDTLCICMYIYIYIYIYIYTYIYIYIFVKGTSLIFFQFLLAYHMYQCQFIALKGVMIGQVGHPEFVSKPPHVLTEMVPPERSTTDCKTMPTHYL